MPELPEVETVCRTLAPHLEGRSLSSFELLWNRTVSSMDKSAFASAISGQTIESVKRRAKLITLNLEPGGAITVHLRMTGELLWLPPGASAPEERAKHLRAEFLLDDGSELLFYDTRKFGRIAYLDQHELAQMHRYFGVEPLESDFTADWLYTNLLRRKRQLKPLLLDQTFIAGLGNIYVDESLYLARLHPLTRSDLVSRDQAQRLHGAIVTVLAGALDRRGTTLRDYRSGLGESGENRSRLLIYGSRPGSPCPRCGTGLERLVVGQRGSIFCPACQLRPATAGTRNL